MRRATSSCNQGDSMWGTRVQRAAAAGSTMVGRFFLVMGARLVYFDCRTPTANAPTSLRFDPGDPVFQILARKLPSQCLICHAWPAQTLCDACIARFAATQSRCHQCALPVPPARSLCGDCTRHAPPLARCIAAVSYAWPWRPCIQRYKFGHEAGLAAPLAQLMMQAPGAADLLDSTDLVFAIPSSPARLIARGFNPPQLMLRHLGRAEHHGLLVRAIDGPAQHTLGRKARQSNMRGVFLIASAGASAVHGRHILLIDDVMTTGATLHEAARVLRRAGAAAVSALVLARDD